jgi:hypothetical protein
MALAILSFSPPAPAPTTNSMFPSGFQASPGLCVCALLGAPSSTRIPSAVTREIADVTPQTKLFTVALHKHSASEADQATLHAYDRHLYLNDWSLRLASGWPFAAAFWYQLIASLLLLATPCPFSHMMPRLNMAQALPRAAALSYQRHASL